MNLNSKMSSRSPLRLQKSTLSSQAKQQSSREKNINSTIKPQKTNKTFSLSINNHQTNQQKPINILTDIPLQTQSQNQNQVEKSIPINISLDQSHSVSTETSKLFLNPLSFTQSQDEQSNLAFNQSTIRNSYQGDTESIEIIPFTSQKPQQNLNQLHLIEEQTHSDFFKDPKVSNSLDYPSLFSLPGKQQLLEEKHIITSQISEKRQQQTRVTQKINEVKLDICRQQQQVREMREDCLKEKDSLQAQVELLDSESQLLRQQLQMIKDVLENQQIEQIKLAYIENINSLQDGVVEFETQNEIQIKKISSKIRAEKSNFDALKEKKDDLNFTLNSATEKRNQQEEKRKQILTMQQNIADLVFQKQKYITEMESFRRDLIEREKVIYSNIKTEEQNILDQARQQEKDIRSSEESIYHYQQSISSLISNQEQRNKLIEIKKNQQKEEYDRLIQAYQQLSQELISYQDFQDNYEQQITESENLKNLIEKEKSEFQRISEEMANLSDKEMRLSEEKNKKIEQAQKEENSLTQEIQQNNQILNQLLKNEEDQKEGQQMEENEDFLLLEINELQKQIDSNEQQNISSLQSLQYLSSEEEQIDLKLKEYSKMKIEFQSYGNRFNSSWLLLESLQEEIKTTDEAIKSNIDDLEYFRKMNLSNETQITIQQQSNAEIQAEIKRLQEQVSKTKKKKK